MKKKFRHAPNKTLLPMLVCLTSLSACSEVPKTQLTQEEQEKIQEVIDSLELAAELTRDVVVLANPETLADKNGDEGGIKKFQEGAHATQETVLELWENNRIYSFNIEDVRNTEVSLLDNASAFFGTDTQGNFIALQKDIIFEYSNGALFETLMHEGAHRFMGHTDEINDLYDRLNAGEQIAGSPEWTQTAISSNDFPFELSGLCRPALFVLSALECDIHDVESHLEIEAQDGDWDDFNELAEKNQKLGPSLSALKNLKDDEPRWLFNAMEPFGITQDTLAGVMLDSTLYEKISEQYRNEIERIAHELKKKYDAPREARTEIYTRRRK